VAWSAMKRSGPQLASKCMFLEVLAIYFWYSWCKQSRCNTMHCNNISIDIGSYSFSSWRVKTCWRLASSWHNYDRSFLDSWTHPSQVYSDMIETCVLPYLVYSFQVTFLCAQLHFLGAIATMFKIATGCNCFSRLVCNDQN
jgi:hypothetical protein